MRNRGSQKMDREREDRKHIIIKNIQKTVSGLSLSARKNPSISPDGFNTLGFTGGGAGADAALFYQMSKHSPTPVWFMVFKCSKKVL